MVCAFDAAIHTQASPPRKRFSLGCNSPFMRLAEYLTAVLRLVPAMSAWSAKNTTCSVPPLYKCEGLWSCDHGHHCSE